MLPINSIISSSKSNKPSNDIHSSVEIPVNAFVQKNGHTYTNETNIANTIDTKKIVAALNERDSKCYKLFNFFRKIITLKLSEYFSTKALKRGIGLMNTEEIANALTEGSKGLFGSKALRHTSREIKEPILRAYAQHLQSRSKSKEEIELILNKKASKYLIEYKSSEKNKNDIINYLDDIIVLSKVIDLYNEGKSPSEQCNNPYSSKALDFSKEHSNIKDIKNKIEPILNEEIERLYQDCIDSKDPNRNLKYLYAISSICVNCKNLINNNFFLIVLNKVFVNLNNSEIENVLNNDAIVVDGLKALRNMDKTDKSRILHAYVGELKGQGKQKEEIVTILNNKANKLQADYLSIKDNNPNASSDFADDIFTLYQMIDIYNKNLEGEEQINDDCLNSFLSDALDTVISNNDTKWIVNALHDSSKGLFVIKKLKEVQNGDLQRQETILKNYAELLKTMNRQDAEKALISKADQLMNYYLNKIDNNQSNKTALFKEFIQDLSVLDELVELYNQGVEDRQDQIDLTDRFSDLIKTITVFCQIEETFEPNELDPNINGQIEDKSDHLDDKDQINLKKVEKNSEIKIDVPDEDLPKALSLPDQIKNSVSNAWGPADDESRNLAELWLEILQPKSSPCMPKIISWKETEENRYQVEFDREYNGHVEGKNLKVSLPKTLTIEFGRDQGKKAIKFPENQMTTSISVISGKLQQICIQGEEVSVTVRKMINYTEKKPIDRIKNRFSDIRWE